MSPQKKIIIGVLIVFSWVGFWNWAGRTLPEKSPIENTQDLESKNYCLNLMDEKNSLEESASRMADDAYALQRSMLRERLNSIVAEDHLTRNEDNLLSEYLSYDLKKIVSEKSDAFGDAMQRNIELKPQIVKIVNKLIKSSVIEPYWFDEVQQMGQDLRSKFQQAKYLIKENPNCFASTSEIEKYIDETLNKIDKDQT